MATLYGDTSGTLSGQDKGKNQNLVGTDNVSNLIVGDAGVDITDSARGGSDTLTGGDASGTAVVGFNRLVGDAGETMSDSAKGGNDTLTGGDASGSGNVNNVLIGDAGIFITDSAQGGNDTLTGGDASGDGHVITHLSAMRLHYRCRARRQRHPDRRRQQRQPRCYQHACRRRRDHGRDRSGRQRHADRRQQQRQRQC